MLRDSSDYDFARALRSGAMFFAAEDFDEALTVARMQPQSAQRDWAIAEAIILMVDARGFVPADGRRILEEMPDSEVASASRDEALELIARR